MQERIFSTVHGDIHYWVNQHVPGRRTLVFLPGLTADHRLFEKQFDAFQDDYNLLTWDAPLHAASRPFSKGFSLRQKAVWLHDILETEHISMPVLVGQSMGGYVSQYYMDLYPDEVLGFVSIDSAPLKKQYMTAAEVFLLRHTYRIFRAYPWNSLVKAAVRGCAETMYGRELMLKFIGSYTREEYCRLSAHGYCLLADAVDEARPYEISCPAILICGENDKAASTKRYNRRWAETTGLPIFWIKDAGHNSNTDKPEDVNVLIRTFADSLTEESPHDAR